MIKKSKLWLKNNYKIYILILLFDILVLFFVHRYCESTFEYVTTGFDLTDAIELEPGVCYSQYLNIRNDYIKEIELRLGTFARENQGRISVSLNKNGKTEETWVYQLSEIPDYEYCSFRLKKPLYASEDDNIFFSVMVETDGSEDKIAVFVSKGGDKLFSDQTQIQNLTACYKIKLDNHSLKLGFLFLLAFVLLILSILFILLVSLEKINFWSLIIGTLLTLILSVHALSILIDRAARDFVVYDAPDSEEYMTLEPQEEVVFQFNQRRPEISSFEFAIGSGSSDLRVALYDCSLEEEIGTWEISERDILHDGPTGRMVRIFTDNIRPVFSGEFALKIINMNPVQLLQINVFKQDDGSIQLCLLTRKVSEVSLYLILLCYLLLGIMIVLLFSMKTKGTLNPHRFFVVAAIPLSIIYLLIFPVWSVPDSTAHFFACLLSFHGIMITK